MCDAPIFILDNLNIYIRFGTKLYRQIVGIPVGTICAEPTPATPKGREKLQKLARTKQTNEREAHRPAPSSQSEVITMLKGKKKHLDKEHGKTLKHEALRSINHKATLNKNNTGTAALERSVA